MATTMATAVTTGRAAFASGNYALAANIFAECIREVKMQTDVAGATTTTMDLYCRYGDALACMGSVDGAWDVFAFVGRTAAVPLDRLHHLTVAPVGCDYLQAN